MQREVFFISSLLPAFAYTFSASVKLAFHNHYISTILCFIAYITSPTRVFTPNFSNSELR